MNAVRPLMTDLGLAIVLTAVLLPTLVASAPSGVPEADEPPPFETVCFGDFDDFSSAEQLKTLLEPVAGQQGKIDVTKLGIRPICAVSGLHRLKAPWQADTVWRLGLVKPQDLQLYFWHGREGVLLRLYSEMNQTWAAYGITRAGKEVQPQQYELWAVDNGRYSRSKAGTFEVRCQDGRLVLSRGDLVLLAAPLGGLPQEVYLRGGGMVRGMAVLRSRPAPLPKAARPVVVRIDRPADLAWQVKQAQGDQGVRLNKLPDGRVELVADRNSRPALAAAKVCRPGLYEYIFEVEDALPGTGICLGGEQEQTVFPVGFFRHAESKQTVFGPWPPAVAETDRPLKFDKMVTPFAGRHQWVRLVLGAGVMRCFTSGDGVFWSEIQPNSVPAAGACSTIGLCCGTGKTPRSIKLRSVEIRRLDALASLAPAELVEKADAAAEAASFGDWEQRVAQSRPGDVSAEQWQRACALRILIENRPHAVGQPVLFALLDKVMAGPESWQAKLRVFDEAALLVMVVGYGEGAGNLAEYYEWLGEQMTRCGCASPSSTVSGAVLRMPGWVSGANAFPQGLLRHDLLTLAQQERWQELGELCRRVKYWTRLGESPYQAEPWKVGSETTAHLLNWADAQVSLSDPSVVQGKRAAALGRWRDPLVERLSKESYNVLAEFHAALEGGAHREACQVICASADADALGLVPDAKDRRLLVSLPTAVELAVQRVPALRQAMQEHFAPLGRLRIKQAIADSDPAAAAAVAARFCGTEAAAEAHAWLGDRWLSRGRFTQATGQYQQALRNAAADQQAGLLARLRLTGAMMGRDVGQPVAEGVDFQHTRLTAAEFEQLVSRVRESRRGSDATAEGAGGPANAAEPCFAPGQYEARPWARWEAPRDVRDTSTWGGRRAAAVIADGQMIVTDQIQQIAFAMESGKQRWLQRQDLKPKYRGWPLPPMRPAVDRAGRVFVRRLAEGGPELACLDAADGRVRWTSSTIGPVASEPLLLGRDVLVLCTGGKTAGSLTLELADFDAESGRLQGRVALAEFTDHWGGAVPCRAALTENRIVATAGGSVLCCDLLGKILWIRRQVCVPPPREKERGKAPDTRPWEQHVHNAPLVVDRRVYATQPGVWAVECLDLETGRLLWRQALPELTSLIGCLERRVVVGTTDGLTALDADSGKVLWRHDADDRLGAPCCGEGGGILYIRAAQSQDSRKRHVAALVWLDPATGQPKAESLLDIPVKREWSFGPLVVQGNRQWLLTTPQSPPNEREVVELVPVNPQPAGGNP